jgi:hypothetical protein
MRYLGSLTGDGAVICDGKTIARASYEFDGFFQPKSGITSSGEIHLEASVLKDLFSRNGIQLRTDDGRLFMLRFSEKKLRPTAETAHVDVTGELPMQQEWRH